MRILKYWAPPLLYMVLIFVISSMEQPPLPMPEFEWLTIDKLYHFIEYAILGGLLTRAFVGAKPSIVPSRLVWYIAALLSILYGASDEWHQTFVPGRFATIADWVADVLGSIAGAFGVYLYYGYQSSVRSLRSLSVISPEPTADINNFSNRSQNVPTTDSRQPTTIKKGINMHPLVDLKVPEGAVAVHWFEQSSFALKDSAGTIVQIDPYFPRERPADRFIHTQPPLDESTLPTNFVLLTHAHGDHTCSETIRRIWETSNATRFVGPEESTRQISEETDVSTENISEIRAGKSVTLNSLTVHAVYAKPPDGDTSADIAPPDVTHLGYVIASNGVTLYFSGDPINNFAEHNELISAVAAHKPDVGFLTNHPTEGEFPFYDGCVKMATRIGLTHAVPVHRACFVTRDYDPNEWASNFPAGGPEPLIIERNSHIIY